MAGYVPTSLAQACTSDTNTKIVIEMNSSSAAISGNSTQSDEKESENEGVKVTWFAVEERIGVYCSVLRLLCSSTISSFFTANSNSQVESQQEDMTKGAVVTPLPASEALRTSAADSISLRTSATDSISSLYNQNDIKKNRPLGTAVSSPGAVLGWKATQAGTRSRSQLLDLAPSVVQDMAVRIADAVAAAYLTEAAQGSWNPSQLSSQADGIFSKDGSLSSSNIINSNSGSPKRAFEERDIVRKEGQEAHEVEKTLTKDGLIMPAFAVDSLPRQQQQFSGSAVSLEASWWPIFAHPRLASTRQLQRFTNRLLVARWLDTAFYSVAAIYDDRLPLFTLCAPGGVLRVRQAPVRRAAQLGALKGVRYGVSLLLEAVDVMAPVLRMLWTRATETVTWVLTYVVGNGIGMVWKGLKLGLKGENKKEKRGRPTRKQKNNKGDVPGGENWAFGAS